VNFTGTKLLQCMSVLLLLVCSALTIARWTAASNLICGVIAVVHDVRYVLNSYHCRANCYIEC